MQNFFRYGSYDFDPKFNLIARREFENVENFEEIESEVNHYGRNKQLELL